MCQPSDVVAPLFTLPLRAASSALGAIMPKPPEQPQVVREDPAAQQAKIESDAAQAAQAKTLDQRRRLRANSLLSRAGGLGDPSTADVSTAQAKPNLGG